MANSNAAFESLKKEIEKVPELKNNKAVKNALDNAQNELKNDSKSLDGVSDIFSTLGKAIGKFTYSGSTQIDIVSGIFDITSSVIKIFALIPGASTIAGSLGTAVGIVGAVIGVFGTSKTTKYFNALTGMVNDAVQKLNDDLTKQSLSGAMEVLSADHDMLVNILSVEHSDLNSLKETYKDFTVKSFTEMAEKELGAAIEYLNGSTVGSNHNNWPIAADTFHKLTELVAFKILCLLESLAYFMLVENGRTDTGSSSYGINASLNSFLVKYNKHLAPFFKKPTVTNAALTHNIYRFTDDKFDFVLNVCKYLAQEELLFFPQGTHPYKFNCTHSKKHVLGASNSGSVQCIRMTTLNARDNHKKNIFTLKPSIPGPSNIVCFYKDNSKDSEYTHFSLEPTKGNKPPYRTWKLESRNICKDLTNTYKIVERRYTLEDIYIFEVFPTDEEIDKSKNWPNEWKYEPDGHSLFMIGSIREDKVLCDHKGSELKMESFYTVTYKDTHYGSPDQCIWVMFNENDMN